jgi:hypothetical protein
VFDDFTEDDRIAESVATVWSRADVGRYRAALAGTSAIAITDPSIPPTDPGYWSLLHVYDEVEDTTICNAAAPLGALVVPQQPPQLPLAPTPIEGGG